MFTLSPLDTHGSLPRLILYDLINKSEWVPVRQYLLDVLHRVHRLRSFRFRAEGLRADERTGIAGGALGMEARLKYQATGSGAGAAVEKWDYVGERGDRREGREEYRDD